MEVGVAYRGRGLQETGVLEAVMQMKGRGLLGAWPNRVPIGCRGRGLMGTGRGLTSAVGERGVAYWRGVAKWCPH